MKKSIKKAERHADTPETPRDDVFSPRWLSTAVVRLRKLEFRSKISKKCGSAQSEEVTTYDPTVVGNVFFFRKKNPNFHFVLTFKRTVLRAQ